MQNAILPKAVKNSLRGLTGPFCFVKLILGMEKNVITFDKGSG